MNYIDASLPRIIMAKKKHADGLIGLISERIDAITGLNVRTIFANHITPYLDTILSGKPKELLVCHRRIKPHQSEAVVTAIQYVFMYQGWFDQKRVKRYDAYDLASNLDVPTCTYCNRIYTKTVVKPKKSTRPSFDHWFPKNRFPLLALSFFNLIPSCSICNSDVKGSGCFKLKTHFHPYYQLSGEDLKIDFKFSYEHKNYSTFKFKIINNNQFSENSTSAFKLKEIYETHEDEIQDLRRLKDMYSDNYLNMLKNHVLEGTSTSDAEIYRLAFGTYIDEAYFDRRPLSRMKRDILEELGILKNDKE